MASSSNSSSASSGGIGFFGLLAIVFIVLKLTGVSVIATWSWWWVLSPLWLPTVAILGIGLLAIVVVFLAKFITLAVEEFIAKNKKKRQETASQQLNRFNGVNFPRK